MTDRQATMSTESLEAALADLAQALAPIPAPNLAAAVHDRVQSLPVPARSRGRWLDRVVAQPTRPFRRALVLAVIAAFVLAGLAVALGFGLPGLRIVILGPSPTNSRSATAAASTPSGSGASPMPGATVSSAPLPPLSSPPIDSLALGQPVSIALVDPRAGYHAILPSLPELGVPLAVYVQGSPPVARVSAAYAATPSVPVAAGAPTVNGTAVAILVMEFPGASPADYLQKVLPPGTTIEPVIVAGHGGFWIAGEPHQLLYVRPDGSTQSDTTRLVGNVLAWNDGDLTIRIEGAPDLATALRIASSMH